MDIGGFLLGCDRCLKKYCTNTQYSIQWGQIVNLNQIKNRKHGKCGIKSGVRPNQLVDMRLLLTKKKSISVAS